jgi:hypothetical protein
MDLVLQNIISPITLAFVLGMVAHWVRSDLEIPDAIYQALSIYLPLRDWTERRGRALGDTNHSTDCSDRSDPLTRAS